MSTATKQIRISLPAMSYDISPFDIHDGRTSFDLTTFCTQFCHAFNDRNEHLPLSTRKDYFAITLRAMQALVFGRDEEQTTNTLHNSLLIDNPDLSTRDLTQLVRLISFYCMDDVDILAAIVARQLKLFKQSGVAEEDARMTLLDNWYRDTIFRVINDVYPYD